MSGEVKSDESYTQDTAEKLLGPMLRKAREGIGATIAGLADSTGLSSPAISNFETGERIPTVAHVLKLAKALSLDPARVMFARAWEQTNKETNSNDWLSDSSDGLVELKDRVLDALRNSTETAAPQKSRVAVSGDHLSLVDWPNAFNVRTVIVGDRREYPPNTVADILALTAATGDLMYFSDLGLSNARIRSDKIVKLARPEDLRAKLNHDILVIGSPAANLAARIVNDYACFRFYIEPSDRDTERQLESLLKEIAYDPDGLEALAKRKKSELSRLKAAYAKPGFIDPIDFKGKRGFQTNKRTDYGVVTVCSNPWWEDGIAILAAGISGPGTAAAVKLLATKGAFQQCPLGGVFKVNIATEAHWEDRFDLLKPVWDTNFPYSIEEFTLEVQKNPRSAHIEHLSQHEADSVMSLLKLLKRRAAAKSPDGPDVAAVNAHAQSKDDDLA